MACDPILHRQVSHFFVECNLFEHFTLKAVNEYAYLKSHRCKSSTRENPESVNILSLLYPKEFDLLQNVTKESVMGDKNGKRIGPTSYLRGKRQRT